MASFYVLFSKRRCAQLYRSCSWNASCSDFVLPIVGFGGIRFSYRYPRIAQWSQATKTSVSKLCSHTVDGRNPAPDIKVYSPYHQAGTGFVPSTVFTLAVHFRNLLSLSPLFRKVSLQENMPRIVFLLATQGSIDCTNCSPAAKNPKWQSFSNQTRPRERSHISPGERENHRLKHTLLRNMWSFPGGYL